MDFALASNSSDTGGLSALVPLFIMFCILGFFFRSIAKRKGINQVLGFIAGCVPGLNLFLGLWLASLPEKSLIDQMKALTDKLEKIDPMPKGGQVNSQDAHPRIWKCNCGMTLDIDVSSCPTCGLKRDYLLRSALEKL